MNNPNVSTVTDEQFAQIRHGDKVTILIPSGIGRNGQEWREATGRAVMIGYGSDAVDALNEIKEAL